MIYLHTRQYNSNIIKKYKLGTKTNVCTKINKIKKTITVPICV